MRFIYILMLTLTGCATPAVDSAEPTPYEPPERPNETHYVWAGTEAVITVGADYVVTLADPTAVVARVGDRLCSVTADGRILDEDADGVCELSPPVALAIDVY